MSDHVGTPLPMLPTTVIGSYSVPDWLERLKSDYYRGGVSETQLAAIHDVAIKAAVKDQELAGIDIVSDGELRRDNDIDYFLARLPGVQVTEPQKAFYYDYFHLDVVSRLPVDEPGVLGLVQDYGFARSLTDRAVKVSLTGPFSLARRAVNSYYTSDDDLVLALAEVLNQEARALAAAGAASIQIDEPFLAGYPEQVGLAVDAINIVTRDVDVEWGLHVCYGNRYSRPSWEGHYDFLFPAVLGADVDQLLLEFARKGYQDLDVVARAGWDRKVGLGVIDVKSQSVEPAETVRSRILRAADLISPEQLIINPDCGLRHLPGDIARAKLAAMVEGAAAARRELGGSAAVPEAAPVDDADADSAAQEPGAPEDAQQSTLPEPTTQPA